jgi:hypothetical protein
MSAWRLTGTVMPRVRGTPLLLLLLATCSSLLALRKNEIDEDEKTLVTFTSDHGPWRLYGDHGGPLREGKEAGREERAPRRKVSNIERMIDVVQG